MSSLGEQEWLSTIMEEYKSLRDESIVAMKNQQSIMRYGIGAIGIIFGFGLQSAGTGIGGIIFSFILPSFCILIFMLWSGEFGRMVRVGRYIEEIENRVNAKFSSIGKALGWEKWLSHNISGKTPRLPFYYGIPGIFFGVILTSNILQFWSAYQLNKGIPDFAIIPFFSILLFELFIVNMGAKLLTLREEYELFFKKQGNK